MTFWQWTNDDGVAGVRASIARIKERLAEARRLEAEANFLLDAGFMPSELTIVQRSGPPTPGDPFAIPHIMPRDFVLPSEE